MPRVAHIAAAAEERLRALLGEEYPPGSQLPAERELADAVGVSRATLREVVSSLCRMGLLERQWGVGTFVATPIRPFRMTLGEAYPLRSDAIRQGFDAHFGPFRVELVPCEAEIADRLELAADEPVWQTERVLFLDGRPAINLIDTVPRSILGVELDMSGFGKDGQVDFIPYVYEQTAALMTGMDATIRPVTASPDWARLLQVDVGTPLIHGIQIARTAAGDIVTHSESLYVHGRVELHVKAVAHRDSTPDPLPKGSSR